MSFWHNRPRISNNVLISKTANTQDLTFFRQRRAFVVLIGWIGARDKQLLKFVTLYKNLGYECHNFDII